MTFAIIAPPLLKPSEPGVSAGAAAEALRRLGVDARSIDASLGWHRFVFRQSDIDGRLAAAKKRGASEGELLALRRASRSLRSSPTRLQRQKTYEQRRVYTSAIRELELSLRLAAAEHPRYRLGVAMVSFEPTTDRVESSTVLDELAHEPSPFDDYFREELIPELAKLKTTIIGVSLSFQQQAPAAFRLAHLLAELLPETPRILGGPLVDCWAAASIDLERPPFQIYDHVFSGVDGIQRAAKLCDDALDGDSRSLSLGPLAVALDEATWEDYLSPRPVVPAALGRGCYWRRCTFCPDHLHPKHHPCSAESLDDWLRAVAARFPQGAMLHLTDSAIPPRHMRHISRVIEEEGLPLAWHGFSRVEPQLADPGFAKQLVRGGCAMLQLGVESGSPKMLEMMHKGADLGLTRRVLTNLGQAGIRTHIYLLFGLPMETNEEREETLRFVEQHRDVIHAINPALLNLPLGSPMHSQPEEFGITELVPFHAETDLSLYSDFRCGASHPRVEARRWLERRFFKNDAVRAISRHLRTPFKANHLCFLDGT